MRIIGGQFKGRTLRGPSGPGVRPTSDGLRETLFNVLGTRIEGVGFLDAYAGTGAVGLEALSRGASHATFIERDRRMIDVLRTNIASCGALEHSTVILAPFVGIRERGHTLGQFEIAFLDPPYDSEDLEATLREMAGLASPSGLIVLEHSSRREAPQVVHGLVRSRLLKAGDSALAFYAAGPSD